MSFPQPTLRLAVRSIVALAMVAALVACGDPKYRAPAIVVTFASPPATPLSTGASEGITAVLTNDTGSNKVNWSCLPDDQPGECGLFTPPQITSNVPTCYTAPDNVPPGNTVTVIATSVTDPTKSISATITIVSGPGQACP